MVVMKFERKVVGSWFALRMTRALTATNAKKKLKKRENKTKEKKW